MAVRWSEAAGVSRTAHGYSVLPENVVILRELSGRRDATDITELAKDIEINNQLEPAVCWKNDSGWPVLAAGHRRYRAIVAINEKISNPEEKRRLLFNYIDARNEQEAFDFTVRENRNRLNPSVLDDATNMAIYSSRFGLNEEQIARKYYPGVLSEEELAKAVREVKDTLALLDLSETAQDELRKGFLSTSAALQLAAIPSRVKQDEVIREAKGKGAKKLKVSDAKAARDEASGKPARKISDNSPVKLLKKHQILSELGCSLAAEVISEDPDWEVLMELARTTIVMGRKLNVPLLPNANKYAENNMDLHTPLDAEEKREMTLA